MKTHTPARGWTRHPHQDPDAADEATGLTNLVTALEASLAADPDSPPTLVVAIRDGDSVEVRLRPLDHHPSLELEGLVAPPEWWCLGTVTGGTARSIDPAVASIDAPSAEGFRVHFAQLVARSGMVTRVLRDRRTDTVHVVPASAAPSAPEDGGLIDDLLRRSFGLPTAPPARDSSELFAALWVHHLMHDAASLDLVDALWSDVAARHPAFAAVDESGEPALRRWATDNLVRAGELMATTFPWARVRAACRDGVGPVTGRPAELAGWLDDGSFARLVMTSFGPMHDLVVDLHELLTPDAYRRLVDTLGAWGVFDPS